MDRWPDRDPKSNNMAQYMGIAVDVAIGAGLGAAGAIRGDGGDG